MSCFSLLTIVKGRRRHLNNLLRGVSRSVTKPSEVIVVHMNQPADDDLVDPGVPLHQHCLHTDDDPLPLARARNLAAAVATENTLIFLDVDCIPHPALLGDLVEEVNKVNGLVMGNIRYLRRGGTPEDWTVADLDEASEVHPRRPVPASGELPRSKAYHLFWSLCFGIRRTDFERAGGFDTRYFGYGAEDTDFAFGLRDIRVPFYLSSAVAYHQYHPTHSPPYNRLDDIVRNALTFREKWRVWPMEGWLTSFAEAGLIDWQPEDIRILRRPDEELLALSENDAPYV